MGRNRRRGKKKKGRRLVEDGFTSHTTDDAILKLQAHQEDAHESLQLERDITAHPQVQAAASITELFLSNIDDLAPPDFILQQLRGYFVDAKQHGHPGHADMHRLSLHSMTAKAAVLSCRKLDTYRDNTGKIRRRGCGIAEVPDDLVADFFCSASQHAQRGGQGINCAPPTRRCRHVNIKRSSRRSPGQGSSEATMKALDVSRVSVMDVDFREVRHTVQGPPKYTARQLWDSQVDSAGIELKSRSIELKWLKSLALSIDLRTIKHVKVLELDGGSQCLALRLRRPPILNADRTIAEDDLHDGLFGILAAALSTAPSGNSSLPRATDVSRCEAFASPTAYVCLSFPTHHAFDATHKALKDFKMNVHRNACIVRMRGSRHCGASGGVSHRLPATLAPLSRYDLAAVGDTEFEVAFLLDLLLRHGHLRAADVADVLGMLRCLCQWRLVKSYSAYLNEAAETLPPFHRCNDGRQVFDTVSSMYQRVRHVRQDAPGGGAWNVAGYGAPPEKRRLPFPHPSHAAAPQLAGSTDASREDVAEVLPTSALDNLLTFAWAVYAMPAFWSICHININPSVPPQDMFPPQDTLQHFFTSGHVAFLYQWACCVSLPVGLALDRYRDRGRPWARFHALNACILDHDRRSHFSLVSAGPASATAMSALQ